MRGGSIMPITADEITISNFPDMVRKIIADKQVVGVQAIQNNPTDLFERAQSYGTQFANQSWGWGSNLWHRSAANTSVVNTEEELTDNHRELMLRVLEHIITRPMIQADASLGSPQSPARMHCRLYCDPQYPDIPYRWQQICFPADPAEQPDATLYFIPQYLGNPPMPNDPSKLLQVIRFPNHDYTICTASSYQGEVKKAFLSHWIRYCYLQGGTGEHAACREFTVKTPAGAEKRIVMGCWGLTGSGKSTHGMYVFNEQIYQRYEDEFGIDFSELLYDNYIRNDDVIGWFEYMVAGSERGSWTKTEGVTTSQAGIYEAAMSADALHENTEWDENGNPSFDVKLFQYHGMPNRNARSVLRLEDTGAFDGSVDSTAPPNMAVFISPGYLTDYAWLKLNDINFATKVLADGRTVGHPAQSQESIGETKYSSRYALPFTMGITNAQHLHRFREILHLRQADGEPIQVYQINTTGKVGAAYEWGITELNGKEYEMPRVRFEQTPDGPKAIGGTGPSLEETEVFLIQAARGAVQWQPHPLWGEKVLVPVSVPGITDQRLLELNPFTYRTTAEMEKLLHAQIVLSKYYNDIQCPGLDLDIYTAMDF